jgi:hypothetical protein
MGAPRAPQHLGTRGRRLWRELLAEGKPRPAQLVLIEEACRIADRLDRLDAVLRGDEDAWARLLVDEDGGEITVKVDSVLSEARQHATALKQIVAELRQSAAGATAAATSGQGGGIRDQLAARRQKRLADSAG